MFWKKKPASAPCRDIQGETLLAILEDSKALPAHVLINAVYSAVVSRKDISVEQLDTLATRLSRFAWERARK